MKTVIFDFGNVVGFFEYGRTLERVAPHTDLSTAEMIARVYASSLEDDVETGCIDSAEFLRRVHRLWELRCEIALLSEAIADIFTPNLEVCELILRLRPRYRVLLGSNTNEVHATQFRRQFADVLGHFDGLVLSYEIGHRKPHAAFFEHCARLADAAPTEIVFIDDLVANVEAARAHGWHGILYRPGEDLAARLRRLGVVV
jgi:putative hydrolase of the HAD superfamily